ncbi:uncharacterized protein N7473_006708 [Penicillium subrubescens]|uniref:uncharacterized protein n=1 Tax=Penicillium subrubescens TaxID=1316194 RepID=UPI00254555A1|nr:uncharacterized protein N7473_006708 [Penicillium subrubescens]KAJ5890480.1 hypothetical protein N7473_006708 [Penicillium subrubescens]
MNASVTESFHTGNWADFLKYLFAGIVCVINASIYYNIYFHPLAKIPGPKAYAASPIPVALAQLGGQFHLFTQAAHERFGGVVRISPNELSFISAEAWGDIYARKQKTPPFPGIQRSSMKCWWIRKL